jgi:hypothetical protein
MVTDKKDTQFRPGAHALDGSYSEAEVTGGELACAFRALPTGTTWSSS